MGQFIYDSAARPFDIDDRTLAHLRIVIMTKLRRAEPFMMTLRDSDLGDRDLWIHPNIPIVLQFYGSRHPPINMAWVDELMHSANSSNGLVISPEPDIE